MSSIHPEYIRIQNIKCTDYTTSANITEIIKWLSCRQHFVLEAYDTQFNRSLKELQIIEDTLRNFDDQICELLNLKHEK